MFDPVFADGGEIARIAVVFLVMAVIAGVAVWLTKRYEKKRTESLATVAEGLGMSFAADQNEALISKLRVFPVFNKGRAQKMKNVMMAETESTSLAIFEYQYTTGGGKNSQTHRFTIAAMESDDLQLPNFCVRPEGFFDRIGSAIGFQDIDFEEHPEFSDSFVLQGNDESAIRRYFDKRILDLFANNKGVLVDANENLLTYRKRGRQSPEAISDFMSEAYAFLNAFQDPNTTQAGGDI